MQPTPPSKPTYHLQLLPDGSYAAMKCMGIDVSIESSGKPVQIIDLPYISEAEFNHMQDQSASHHITYDQETGKISLVPKGQS